MKLGERLKTLRLQRGWSLRQLERETDRLGHKVSNAYISQLENDDKYDINPSLATLDVIARALGASLVTLLQPADGPSQGSGEIKSLIITRATERMRSLNLGSDLGKVTKMSDSKLASITDDHPDLALVQRLAYHLNTTMHYLLGRTDDPSPLPGVAVAHHDPESGVEPGDPMPPETQLVVERAILAARKEWGWDEKK